MTKQEIMDGFGIEGPITFLEPSEVFNDCILGISADDKHIIYGYYNMCWALSEQNRKDWESEEHDGEPEPDFYWDAVDYIDYNILRFENLSYEDDRYPIVMYEIESIKDNAEESL
jgi:hypothetical protein